MDVSTGHLYPNRDMALAAGVKPADLVELSGPPAAVEAVSRAVMTRAEQDRRRKRNRMARASRRANRK